MNTETTNTTVQQALEATDTNFTQEVLGASGPVLVDFWATWCGPCRMIAPLVSELANDYAGRAKVAKLNVDTSPETAAKYNITGIPTLLVFKNGQVVEKIVGAASKKAITAKLDAHLS